MRASTQPHFAPAPQGPPEYVKASRPGQKADTRLHRGVVGGQTGTRANALPAQVPYKRFEITDPSAFPYSTQGKLFFKAGSSTGKCSATAVTSSTKSLIVTAAHCVNPGNNQPWYNNFNYIPGYRGIGGPYLAPFGSFSGSRIIASSNWLKYSNRDYDVAVIVLRTNAKNQLLQNVTGSRGIAFNQSRSQAVQIFGYPGQAPFDGSKLWECDSTTVNGYFGITLGAGCDMTPGSSGGGWVIGKSILNSVNGYKMVKPSQPGMVYGSYFGNSAKSLYDKVK